MVSIGDIVKYRLSASDKARIGVWFGNPMSVDDVFPMVVVRAWPHEFGTREGVNGQVFLDGSGTLWVTSAHEVNGVWTCEWPSGVIK